MLKELPHLARLKLKPFHDDPHLQALVVRFIEGYGIKTFLETGTFKGDTLRWMADRFPSLPCVSVEKNRMYFIYSLMKTRKPNALIVNEDSREFLGHNLRRMYSPVLFWLDAHWGDDWPLLKELFLITSSNVPCVIIVDDFKVPARPSLGFDSYVGRELDYGFLKHEVEGLPAFVPDYDGEDGFRGYLVLFQGLEPIQAADLITVK